MSVHKVGSVYPGKILDELKKPDTISFLNMPKNILIFFTLCHGPPYFNPPPSHAPCFSVYWFRGAIQSDLDRIRRRTTSKSERIKTLRALADECWAEGEPSVGRETLDSLESMIRREKALLARFRARARELEAQGTETDALLAAIKEDKVFFIFYFWGGRDVKAFNCFVFVLEKVFMLLF